MLGLCHEVPSSAVSVSKPLASGHPAAGPPLLSLGFRTRASAKGAFFAPLATGEPLIRARGRA
jgi:hypothetical protein